MAVAVVGLDRRQGKYLRGVISQKFALGDDFQRYDGKSFKVTYIVDGDTLDIDVADDKYDHTRIRLLGIDTPEVKNRRQDAMYYGPEASRFASRTALGKEVTVLLDKESGTRDKYGRLLAHVLLADGRGVNEELVRKGFAYVDLRFENERFDRYVQLEVEARETAAGLWKEVSKEQLPRWLQRMRPGILDEKN